MVQTGVKQARVSSTSSTRLDSILGVLDKREEEVERQGDRGGQSQVVKVHEKPGTSTEEAEQPMDCRAGAMPR